MLCIGGVGYFGYNVAQGIINNPAKNEGVATIEQSESVADAFGPPVSVNITAPPQTKQEGKQGEIVVLTFEGEVTGSEKSGTATIVVRMSNPLDPDSSVVDSITVKDSEGNEVPVKKMDLDISIDEGETVEE